MHKQTKTLAISSIAVLASILLSGCGGSGASGNVIATKLAASYSVTLIEAPAGATGIQFESVSPNGQNAYGSYQFGDEIRHIFKYQGGAIQELTTGPEDLKVEMVNESGVAVGYFDNNGPSYPFVLNGASLSTPGLLPDSNEGWVPAVDSEGNVYSSYDWTDGTTRSFKTKDGVSTPITCNSNDNLQVSTVSPGGFMICSMKEGNSYVQKSYDPKTSTWQAILSTSTSPFVSAVNDSGTMVGGEKVGGTYTSFVEIGGVHHSLPSPGSTFGQLSAVSAGNIAVGSDQVDVSGTMTYHAFGWDQSTGYVDLNTRMSGANGFIAQGASGVDNQGRIYGAGYKNGIRYAYIMTPMAQ